MPFANCCSMCFLNVLILHPRYSLELISLSFSKQYKYGALRPQQGVQGDRNLCTLILCCCAQKFDFRHNLCVVILSCCARKSDFCHKKDIVILSCCAHKSGFRHNLCIVIFSCCAHKFDFRHNPCILILLCL